MNHPYKVKLTNLINSGATFKLLRKHLHFRCQKVKLLPFSEWFPKDGASEPFLKGSKVPASILLTWAFRPRSFDDKQKSNICYKLLWDHRELNDINHSGETRGADISEVAWQFLKLSITPVLETAL